MEQAVAYACLVDVAGLGVADAEVFVAAMFVRSRREVAMECKDIVHQTMLELLHVFLLAFASHELTPRGEEILDRDDILV